jgi:protein-tyrosine phosphatase
MQFKNILTVCVGNICRSPTAEYLLKQACPELKVHSAGLSAMVNHPADDKAQHCMSQIGINMAEHRARQINATLLKEADLILVMSQNQQNHIEKNWPFTKGKIFRLGHWQNCNIADPYQHDQVFFNQTFQLIQQCTQDWKQYF